ncbi:transglycosylase [Coemansia sp. RSA 2049]|nr:transglycosylase [Coemansia sp. RSA 2049]KAJ2518476.1 transglycosylase [Coemansia sp. RSA 1939]KAJ2590416.1 transglycosylase [Coemansia sp. RSA 1804]KAJ2687306.1 transglycosylase [Coemansia sp. RSA 1285]
MLHIVALVIYLIGIATSLAAPTTSNKLNVRQTESSARRYTCESAVLDFSDPQALSKFNVEWCPQNVYQSNGTLIWKLTSECGTTVTYPWDFQYGKIEGRIRMAPGSGVVTSMLLAGPAPSDELDWEWVGKDTWTVQSMYFVKGQRVDPNAQFFHTPGNVPQEMSAGFHNYAIEVNKDSIKWYIDDWLTRTLPRTSGVPFPSDASGTRMGVWDGSQTSGWAGTVNWAQGPFTAEMQWFKFTPYC